MRIKVFAIILPCLIVLSLTTQSYAANGDADVVSKLKRIHITLTEGNRIKEKMVSGWLTNNGSGYPNLVSVLFDSIKCPTDGCKVKGPYLPLDVIEGWCRQNRGNPDTVILNHTPDEVREAYLMTWYERNGHETRELTIEQILSGE